MPGEVGRLQDFLGHADYPDDFWETETLEASGIDPGPIDSVLSRIENSGTEIHAFLVSHRGKLVVERYGFVSGNDPDHPEEPHQVLPTERRELYSSTKSFLSALVGIALEEGALSSVDDRVMDYFADWEDLEPSPEKDTITLEDLLTMRSGFDGDESSLGPDDPARQLLARPVVGTVGETWAYNSGNSDILAAILRTATSETPLEYAETRLFGPLGIPTPVWEAADNGTQRGGFGLSLSARELARFGELYRNAGSFLDMEVVPANWTDESTMARCATPWGGEYAYHFWVPDTPPGFFQTLGAYGQVVFVSRELELVVVFTANLSDEIANTEFKALLRGFIVPAVGG
jgi:CubicO group peptidase (beta-lactamase class C family)